MLLRQLQNDLPPPSDFAQPSVWPEAQEGAPILCLRPSDARGLPLTTLHHVFRRFQYEISRPLAMTTETVAVQIAASVLCSRMGEAFDDERSRGKAFDECVSGVLEKGEADWELKPYPSGHYGKIDRCIREANVPIALREDKLELGHGGSDAYMKIACCYNLLVGVLTSCSAKDSNATNFLTHGAPCFLICLIGTQCCSLILAYVDLIPRADVDRMWWVLWWLQTNRRTTCPACIYVGRSHPDSSRRSSKTAGGIGQGNIIFVTVRARWKCVLTSATHSVTCRLVTEPCEISFAPSTPRIYNSCTLLEQKDEDGTLIFVSRLNYGYKRLSLATLSSPSIPGLPSPCQTHSSLLFTTCPQAYGR